MASLPRRLLAEFLGSFAWVLVAIGAICAGQLRAGSETEAARLLAVAAAQASVVAAMVALLAPISGAHLNPAVTMAFWVTRRMNTPEALAYWLAQLLGGYGAAVTVKTILPDGIWRPVLLGAPALAPDLLRAQGMLLEGVLTFLVVLVFVGLVIDSDSARPWRGLLTGLAVGAAVLVASPYTGGALNPARALGPALAGGFWAAHGVFWVGPLAGGVLAGWLHDQLFARR
ncbi:MAG: aquaporin [Firmicutes bacterium]|nr:aquaporin [Bacillota bacterium]